MKSVKGSIIRFIGENFSKAHVESIESAMIRFISKNVGKAYFKSMKGVIISGIKNNVEFIRVIVFYLPRGRFRLNWHISTFFF